MTSHLPTFQAIVHLRQSGKAFALVEENDELMKKYSSLLFSMLALVLTLSSCRVIGGIFKAGVWVGIMVVVVVIGLILWLVGRGRR